MHLGPPHLLVGNLQHPPTRVRIAEATVDLREGTKMIGPVKDSAEYIQLLDPLTHKP